MERKLLGMFEYRAEMPAAPQVCWDLRIERHAALVLMVVAAARAPDVRL